MRVRHPVLSVHLIAAAVLAAVLCAPAAAQSRIEQQMTPEEFRAAGLDQLSPEQLARLNAWLNRTLEVETTKAAESATKKVKDDNRGFFNFGSNEPIVARMSGEFRGFARGRTWTLDNGQVWRQIDDASLEGVRRTNPAVKITPSIVGNAWYMAIEGYNTRAKVVREK